MCLGVLGALIAIFYVFVICVTACEFSIFLGTGPVGMVIMSVVTPELRGMANAGALFFMHLLGDFPSPFLIGVLFSTIGLYAGMIIALAWLIFAALFWGWAWLVARKHHSQTSPKDETLDFRERDTKENISKASSKDEPGEFRN